MEGPLGGGGGSGHNTNPMLSWPPPQPQMHQDCLHQAAALQQQHQQQFGAGLLDQHSNSSTLSAVGNSLQAYADNLGLDLDARRIKPRDASSMTSSASISKNGIPKTITNHTHLLEPNDPDGSRLYAYYRLSIDEIFRLPPTGRAQDLIVASGLAGNGTDMPYSNPALAALSAAQFAELALGALVHNEVAWAMELCNCVVHCLRDSCHTNQDVMASSSPVVQYEIARAYFLLGVFRACRGDMARYFKYRSVCLVYLSKLEVSSLICSCAKIVCVLFEANSLTLNLPCSRAL